VFDTIGQYKDGMNLYQYPRSNPLNRVDPWGLYSYGGKCPDCREKFACLWWCGIKPCQKGASLAKNALSEAQKRYPGSPHNGNGDAWRHCYWSCEMTRSIGRTCAKRIGDNHEDCGDRYGQPPSERSMDEHNNSVGQGLASKSGNCANLCEKALKDGDLKVITL